MNVESFEEKDLQPPLIIQDENGNKCVRNAIASAPLNGSTVGCNQQRVGPEDYTKCKAASGIQTTSSDLHCTEIAGLQNVAHDYICMGTSHVEARKAPSPTEQPYMYALNQTFPEPEGLLKDCFAIKRTQNFSTEGPVPYCQADRYPVPLAVNINTDIQDKPGCSQIEQEDASSSDSFITVVNLGETVGSKCYEVGCVPSSSRETCKSVACAQNAVLSKPDSYSNQNAPGIMYLDRGVLPSAPTPTGNATTNYMDLVSQKNEQQKKQGLQGAEWDDCHCRSSPELELFNVFKEEKKKYMHSTPEHDKKECPGELAMDDTISGLSHMAIHSFSEHSELEFHKDAENLTNVQNIYKGDQALLKEHDKASKMVENDIPKLERAAAPEPHCQATFVIFNPTADEHCLTSIPTTGSKNATFAVFTMPVEVAGGISKLGKNSPSIKEQPRRNSLKTNSEKNAIKSTNRSPFGATITKARKAEIVSFPKPNFKNIKPKVISRPASQPKENAALKAAQRSPQLSTASSSSPSSSPRQIALRKKTDLDKGTKTEAPVNKTYKQNVNKHLPSQAVQAATHSENTSHKFPKTTASKQNVEQPGKARCPSSACSPVAVTCSLNSAGTPNPNMENAGSCVQPCPLNSCQMPQEEEQQNDFLQVPGERSAQGSADEAFPLGHAPSVSLPKPDTAVRQSFCKDSPVPLRRIPATKAILRSRKGSDSKNGHATKATSPQRALLSSSTGVETFSPKGRLVSLKTTPGFWTSSGKSLPKSKVPIKGPGFRRTSSISSVSSTQSDQSTCSNHSTNATIIIKNGEWSSKSPYKNGTAGSISLKPVPRPRTLSLKNTPKGAKSKLGSVSQCVPKSAGPILPGRKTSDPRGSQRLGPSGQNGPRSVLSTFSAVDKGKQKNPKNSCIQTQTSTEVHSTETKTHEQLTQYKGKCENQSGIIRQLKKYLASSNQKFEALALVIQHLQYEREEVLKQRKELSLELLNLRGELVTSSAACEKLEKDRHELQAAYEAFVQKLNQQHQSDLSELEERLKQFYTAECEKLQNICIEEAEKYKAQLQEQVDNLNVTHENFKLELETSHTEKIDELKKDYESSLSELKKTHESERKTLEASFHEKQEQLEGKIGELQSENDALNEKLKLEEQKRIAKEKANLKTPQIMYLEQELESLKAVLEIKNEKLHQQDIKLLKMEKLVENNAALMEKMRKLQQENEELKARMDKHMELSRQLSTEQAVLQESLEKESKVNKRLSMENEELLWKLHNGDLCSPKKLSPSTPPMPFQSPRNSSSFSSPSVSPR